MAQRYQSIEVPVTPSDYLNELLRTRFNSPTNSLLKHAIGKFVCFIVRLILLIYNNTRESHVVDDPYNAWMVSGLAVAVISLTLAGLAKYICAVTLYGLYNILFYGISMVYLTVQYLWKTVSTAVSLCGRLVTPRTVSVIQYVLGSVVSSVCQLACVLSLGVSVYSVVFFDLTKTKSGDVAGICPICMERTVNCALRPCGHTLCRECSEVYMSENIPQTYTCPICRQHVRNVIDIYI